MINNLKGAKLHALTDTEINVFMRNNGIKGQIVNRDTVLNEGVDNYVINLDLTKNGGTHWVALHKLNKDSYVYMDSFGNPPPENVKNLIINSRDNKGKMLNLYYMDNKLQDDKSLSCGYYALHFLYFMNNNKYDINKYHLLFNRDTKKNDAVLKMFFQTDKKTKSKKIGKGFDLVEKLNKYIPFELHIPYHQYTGPGTDLKKRIENYEELQNADLSNDNYLDNIKHHKQYAPYDEVDAGAQRHDIEYTAGEHQIKDKKKLLEHKHKADERLKHHAFKAMKNSKNSIYTRLIGGLVGSTMWAKLKLGFGINEELEYTKNLFMLYGQQYPILLKQFQKLNL